MCKVPVAVRGTEQKPVGEGEGQELENKDESCSSYGCGWRGLQQPHLASHVKMKKSHEEPLRVLGREETHSDLYSEMNTLAIVRASPRVTHVILKNKLRTWCSGYHPLQEGKRESQSHQGSGRGKTKLAPDPEALFYTVSLALIREVKEIETRGNALG